MSRERGGARGQQTTTMNIEEQGTKGTRNIEERGNVEEQGSLEERGDGRRRQSGTNARAVEAFVLRETPL